MDLFLNKKIPLSEKIRRNKKVILVPFLLLFYLTAGAQSGKLKKIENEIHKTRNLLKSIDTKSDKTYLKFKLLDKQIKYQERYLQKIAYELQLLDKKISKNSLEIKKLSDYIQGLKKEYEALILYAYKTRNMRTKMMYLLSAESFNQAYRRFSHLRYMTEYIDQLTSELSIKNDSLTLLNNNLQYQKNDKLLLKDKQTDELLKLGKSKVILNNILGNLKSRKKELLAEIKKKEKIAARLSSSVKRTINNHTVSKKEYIALSSKFKENKGKLPFPAKGVIASSFGRHTHAVLKNVKVNNDGVEIAVEKGEKAKNVHAGIVSSVLKIPGSNNAVIIKHGNYFTVHSNLKKVYVKKGQRIKRGVPVGLPEGGMLNFQIWYKNKKLNPQKWLR